MVDRIRLRFGAMARGAIACAAIAVLVATAPAGAGAHPGTGRGGPARTYLALGDSLAFGYQQAKFNELLPNESPAAFDTGYVDDLAYALRLRYPRLQVLNDGCPGETTDSFIEGPCRYQLSFPLHHPYAGGPSSSQLSDALGFLSAHRNFVNPITIDIGANDALGVVNGVCNRQPACIAEHAPALFAHIAANLGLILADLRERSPHAKILVLGVYNPFGATITGADQLTGQLNEVMGRVAASVGAHFADPQPQFNPPGPTEHETICMLTNMCTPLEDIHPTDLGYMVLAGLLLEQLATPPFGPPQLGAHQAGRSSALRSRPSASPRIGPRAGTGGRTGGRSRSA